MTAPAASLILNPGERNILRRISLFAAGKRSQLYLVGGILRDMLLGRSKENPDFDFCLKDKAISFGQLLSRKLHAGFVVLDKENGCCRLVKKIQGKTYTFDFTDFRGKNLEEDLLHRDFTVNTLAVRLDDFLKRNPAGYIIDLYGAKEDIKRKTVRAVTCEAFREDPLRILRAFSTCALFDFRIEDKTLKLIRIHRKALAAVSWERIREEFFKILSCEDSHFYLKELDELGILEMIFPEIKAMRNIGQGPYHHLDVWEHTLETVRQLELLFKKIKRGGDISAYLAEEVSFERSRYLLLKLAALLHDIGKPSTLRREEGKISFHGHERVGVDMIKAIAKRLKLSNDELALLKRVVICHLRPGFLSDLPEISERAKFRFFRDAGKEAISTLVVSLADQRATKGPLTTAQSRLRHERTSAALIREYFRKRKQPSPRKIVDGNDLIRKFKLEPSPLIGRMLSEINELTAIGEVRSKPEAYAAAKKIMQKDK